MIRGVHTMFYSSDAKATRAFIRDVIGWSATDVGEGWLIFDAPEADLGCHPSYDAPHAQPGTQAISFYCDHIATMVAELRERGVHFTREITDEGLRLVTYFDMPGGLHVQLYQPHSQK